MNAIRELISILYDASQDVWEAADLANRLRAWWWVVTHPHLLDEPASVCLDK